MTRMRRITISIVVVVLLLAGVLHYLNQSSLTILVDGAPATSMTVTDIQTWTVYKTDGAGRVCIPTKNDEEHHVQFTDSNGCPHLMGYPTGGHTIVDIRGRHSVSTTVHYDYGLIRKSSQTEQYSFTDEEAAAIKSGETTVDAVKRSILQEEAQ